MTNNGCTVNIELSAEAIRSKPDSEKLALLIEIGLQNHIAIQHQGEILEGCEKDGKWMPGLCEQVRAQKANLNWLWISFTAVASFYSGTLMIHVLK